MEAAAKAPLSCCFCTFVSCSLSFLCGVWRGGDCWALESAARPVGRPVFLSSSELRRLLPVSLERFAPLSRVCCLMFQTFFMLRTRTARRIPPRPGILSTQSAARFCALPPVKNRWSSLRLPTAATLPERDRQSLKSTIKHGAYQRHGIKHK